MDYCPNFVSKWHELVTMKKAFGSRSTPVNITTPGYWDIMWTSEPPHCKEEASGVWGFRLRAGESAFFNRWVADLSDSPAQPHYFQIQRLRDSLSISSIYLFSPRFSILLSLSLSHSICIHFLVRSESWETTLCFFTSRSPERLAE